MRNSTMNGAAALLLGVALGACSSNTAGTVGGGDGGTSGEGGGRTGDSGRSADATRDGHGHGGGSADTGLLTGGDSSTTVTGDAACGAVKSQAQKLPVDLVFGIDQSFSMDFQDKWSSLSAALESFVADPASAGLDMGIQFFPLRDTCDISAYASLAVPVGPQATVAPLIKAAIDGTHPAGGTPTVQVLQGLVAYLQANTTQGYKPVIVLATDGVPDETCLAVPDGGTPNSLTNAEAVATQAFGGTPSIPIFVIGVGSDLTALNALAAAGGTGSATLVDVGSDAGNQEQAFINALNAIRQQAIPCNFALAAGTTVDPSLTNVDYSSGSGPAQAFVYVGTAAQCSQAPTTGWYFDDPTHPTQVILCSGACSVVKADPAAQVNVLLGCPRNSLK